ncbi:MAG: hypothetical protein ACFFC7_02555 [Candidatus Hermodarchaeota archaeon]
MRIIPKMKAITDDTIGGGVVIMCLLCIKTASTFIAAYLQLKVEVRLKLLSFSTQEIFEYVRKWATTNHPGTAHATDRGDIYD